MVRNEPILDSLDHDEQPYVYRRPGRTAQARYDEDDVYDGYDDGEPATLIDRVLAAPGKLAMCVVVAVAFTVVGVNAAFMQPGAHPSPFLSTRGDAPALAMPQTEGRLSERSITMAPVPVVPPERSYDSTASIGTAARGDDAIAALVRRSPYDVPSPIARPRALAVPPAVALPATPAITPPAAQGPRAVETIAIDDPIGALLAPVVSAARDAGTSQPLPPSAATRSAQPIVAAVQEVLADMGYEPGGIDGVIGPSTEEAIRRFQLRRALEPNGQITTDLLREIERVTGTRISAS